MVKALMPTNRVEQERSRSAGLDAASNEDGEGNEPPAEEEVALPTPTPA